MNKNYYIAPSEIHGDGLFARVDFKKGGMVGLAHVNDQPATEIGKFHNHDEKNPTMISKKIGNKRYVYANQDLKAGTELTTNYRMQPELGQPEEFDVPKAQDGIFLSSGKFRPQTNTIGSTLGFKKVFPKRDTTWSLTGNVGYGKNLEADKEGLAASINAENFGKFFGGQRRVNAVTNLEAFLEPDNYGGQFTAGPNLHWGTHPKRSLPRGTGRLDFQPFNLRVGYQSTPYQTDSGDALFDNATGRISWGYGAKLKGEYKPKLKGRFRPTLFGDLGVDADFLMQDYDQDKIDAGSITSSNEGFKIKPSFSANLGIRVPIDGSRLRRRRRPDPVEEDDVYYNPGIRTSDPNSVEAYEEPEAYQEGGFILDLDEQEVQRYAKGGYILEELEEGGEDDNLITYKNNKNLIDSVANWDMQSDVDISSDYNDQIKARLLTGNYGYNPKTGALVKLDKSEQTIVKDKDARETRRALKKLKEMQHKDEDASFKDLYGQEDFQREDFTGNFLSPYAVGHPVFFGKGGPDDRIAKDYRGGLSDLYRYYGGLPLQNNILQYSKTAPTDAKDKDAKYISINKDQVFLDEVWKNYLRVKSGNLSTTSQGDKEQKVKDGVWRVSGYSSGGPDHHRTKKQGNAHHSNAIGRYKLSEGKDDKGHFIQYYDKFDQGTGSGDFGDSIYDFVEGVTDARKPFEIYDRIYYNPQTMERTYKEDFKEGGYILEELAGGGEDCPEGYVLNLNGECVKPDHTGSSEENANIKDELEAQGYKDETSLLKDAPPGLSMFSLKPGQSVEDLLGSLKEHPFARTDKDKEFIKKNKKDWQDFIKEFFWEGLPGDKTQKEWGLDPNKPNWNFYRENAKELEADIYDDQGNVMNTIPSYAIQKYFGDLTRNNDGGSDAMFKREDELKKHFWEKTGRNWDYRYEYADFDGWDGSKLLRATLHDTEKSGKYKPLYVDLQKEYEKMPFNIQEEPVVIEEEIPQVDILEPKIPAEIVVKEDLPIIPLPVAEEEVIEQPLPSAEEFYADSLPVTNSEGEIVVPYEETTGKYRRERRGVRRPGTKNRTWDGVKGNLQRIFTDKEYSGPWFPNLKRRIKQEGGPIIKQRKGVRENFDHSVWTPSGEFSKPSSVSSHLMAAEEVPGRGWVGFPTLFQGNPYVENESMLSTNVGEWLDMSDQNNGWWPIYEEADRRGEVYDFGEDKEAALAFGEGSWKDQLPIEIELSDEEVERYRAGGYIIEEI